MPGRCAQAVSAADDNAGLTESEVKSLFLTLDLPPAPLYKDSQDKLVIPQASIFTILEKFDGPIAHPTNLRPCSPPTPTPTPARSPPCHSLPRCGSKCLVCGAGETSQELRGGVLRRLRLMAPLPRYLILIFKRFKSNQFFVEKNPTLVSS